MALAQHSLYGKCYVSAIIHLELAKCHGKSGITAVHIWSFLVGAIRQQVGSILLPFGLWVPGTTRAAMPHPQEICVQ